MRRSSRLCPRLCHRGALVVLLAVAGACSSDSGSSTSSVPISPTVPSPASTTSVVQGAAELPDTDTSVTTATSAPVAVEPDASTSPIVIILARSFPAVLGVAYEPVLVVHANGSVERVGSGGERFGALPSTAVDDFVTRAAAMSVDETPSSRGAESMGEAAMITVGGRTWVVDMDESGAVQTLFADIESAAAEAIGD